VSDPRNEAERPGGAPGQGAASEPRTAPRSNEAERLLEAERLMTVGLVDHAEAIYRDLAAADPADSHALVGLARVALERGEEQAAHDLAATALAADPGNEAAIRLEARMAEVLAFRRETAPPRPAAAPRRCRSRAGGPWQPSLTSRTRRSHRGWSAN